MDLIYAKINDNKIATIRLSGPVKWEDNAEKIANEINRISDEGNAERIDIRINSEGGSVMAGIRIVAAILNSKIPVHTYNDGYAMSMGAMIWLAAEKKNRHMANFASNMFHAPSIPGKAKSELSDKAKEYLDVTYNQLSQLLQNQTSKSAEEIDQIFSKDTFFNAEQSVKEGLIESENIINYAKTPTINNELPIRDQINQIAAFYQPDNKKSNSNNKNTNKMKIAERINNLLNLNPEASETITVEAVNQLQADNQSLTDEIQNLKEEKATTMESLKDAEASVKELETKVAGYEKAEAQAADEKAENAVKDAIKNGKFGSKKEAELIAIAKKDFEMFNTMVESISVKAPDIASEIVDDKAHEEYEIKAEEFDFENLEAKHPEVLAKIEKSKPKLFAKLLNDYSEKHGVKVEAE